MKEERITLCKSCKDVHYPELRQPNNTASYLATGICKKCHRRTSVKSYVWVEDTGLVGGKGE